ncbi:OmpA family protein [Thiotrichales bacterium HSG1]|nr:OmpA family protein [Thiotrichales bacterium HSG1]
MYFNALSGILITILLLNVAVADDWKEKRLFDSQGKLVTTEYYECVKTSGASATYMRPDICYQNKDDINLSEDDINLPGDIMFSFGKSVLTPFAENVLKNIIAQIDMYALQNLVVIGHTDNIGSEQYNQKLSTQRAANVANYLVNSGIPIHKLRYYGVGEREPIASNTTDVGRNKNRRVTIKILP